MLTGIKYGILSAALMIIALSSSVMASDISELQSKYNHYVKQEKSLRAALRKNSNDRRKLSAKIQEDPKYKLYQRKYKTLRERNADLQYKLSETGVKRAEVARELEHLKYFK
jgi:predicted  nucleic acid-binding Zn-ribbon protein